MPRFRDTNDFVDRERDFPSEIPNPSVVSRLKNERFSLSRRLVKGELVRPSGRYEPDRNEANAPSSAPPLVAPSDFDDVERPSQDDGRRYSPSGSRRWPSTLSGSPAPLVIGSRWLPVFASSMVIPCVERRVRREVLFARKKAGRGYRTRKRRNVWSTIGC